MGQLPRITTAEVEVIRFHLNEPEIRSSRWLDMINFYLYVIATATVILLMAVGFAPMRIQGRLSGRLSF